MESRTLMVPGNNINLIRGAFEHRIAARIPRGELWLGTKLLKKADLKDNLEGHIELVKRLGQDLICLPISNDLSFNKALGYRYFRVKDLEKASRTRDLFVMAVIDGPFQMLTEKKGLMNLLYEWKQEKDSIRKQYEQEAKKNYHILDHILEQAVDAVIIADDLAGERSPLLDPRDIQELFSPFYIQAISKIHNRQSYALLHSCGNISMLLPQIITYGFDGLAAIQHQANNLIAMKKEYGSRLVFMAGIEGALLEAKEISSSLLEQFQHLLQTLHINGGFILSSCTGLYSDIFFERVRELYQITDNLFKET
jgi:uroporphyrinogen-III decarboxylase